MEKYIFSVCSFEGEFRHNLILSKDKIINEDYSPIFSYGGFPILTYIDDYGNKDDCHFINKTIIE